MPTITELPIATAVDPSDEGPRLARAATRALSASAVCLPARSLQSWHRQVFFLVE